MGAFEVQTVNSMQGPVVDPKTPEASPNFATL